MSGADLPLREAQNHRLDAQRLGEAVGMQERESIARGLYPIPTH
jgi:hypothetical protein